MKNIYFLAGLPRSGSTVLAALLNQHPQVHASATSGLLDILVGTLKAWSEAMSTQASPDKKQSEREIQKILRNICDTKYDHIDKPVILDKARGWASQMNIGTMAMVLGHKPKIVATVRNIPDCAASFVRIAKPEDEDEFCRDSELIDHLKKSYQTLEEGYRFAPECILCVDYDDLISDPMTQLRRVEEFLGLDKFDGYKVNEIDGGNLKELDEEVWQVKGLHDIKPELKRYSSSADTKQLLGRSHDQFLQPRFWLGETASPRPIHKLDMQLAAGLLGNFEQGWKLAQELEQEEPWNHRAAFNRGWYRMWNGDLFAGSEDMFRGRIEKVYGNEPPKVPTPMWDGESKGVVLLNLEGGLGDQIHGAGFIRYIVDKGCQVIVACSGQLATLFRDIPGVLAVVQHEAVFGVVHDFWCPSMSAVLPLNLEYKDVRGGAYISKPDVLKGNKKRIGLRWQGNPQFEHEQHRLFPPARFFDAVGGHDVEYISLQRDEGFEHKPYWVKEVPLNHWEETRIAIASCDLVITSCTSVAHLAAAMGVLTWIIVPVLPYYLWAKSGSSTEWYDSVKLIRQKQHGDWSAPMLEVQQNLKEFLNG
jgi:Sulfotransferase family